MFRTIIKAPLLRAPVSRFVSVQTVVKPSFTRFYSEEVKKEQKNQEATDAPEITGQDEHALREELDAAKKEIANFKDLYLRSVADFRNLQESTKREIKKSKELALKSFAKDLLEVADTFEIALKSLEGDSIEQQGELKNLIEGVQLTQNQFLNTLKRHGLERMEPIGEKFDPNVHEATFEVPQPDKEAGTVFFVQQAGFYLNGRVLRPAKVGVVQGSD